MKEILNRKFMATLLQRNQKPKTIKNLGWLLRNWQSVEKLGFNYDPDNKRTVDGTLVACLKDGAVYMTEFASLPICWAWLNRLVFRGQVFSFVNFTDKNPNGPEKINYLIGSGLWIEKQKLEYKDFMASMGLEK